MLDLWNDLSLAVFDLLLGWLLYFPSDIVLLSLALLTGAVMVLTRPLATNQDLLRRIDEDRRRIKELMGQAKKNKDGQALTRYRTTTNQLAMRKLAAEFKPLLLAIVPVAMLATWAMARVAYHPPTADDDIELVAYMPSTTLVGQLIHLVPTGELKSKEPWIQVIAKQPNEPTWWDRMLVRVRLADLRTPEPDAVARWTLKGPARPDPYELAIPLGDKTVHRKLIIGQTIYADPLVPATEDEPITTQVKLRPVLPFGFDIGLGEYLPGWLVGYLIVVVPLVFALKWTFDIY